MKQIRHLVITWGGGNNGALFYHPFTPTQKSSATLASSATIKMPAAGTIRKLAVKLITALGGGDSITVRFNQNGSASALTVTVTDPATTASDTTNSVSLALNDQLVLVRTGAGAPAAGVAMISYEWEPTVANTSIYGFGGQNDTIAAVEQIDGLLDGGGNGFGAVADADKIKTLVGIEGTVGVVTIELSAAPGVGNTRTATVWKNGTAQDGSGGTPDTRIVFGAADTSGSVSFSLDHVSGDYLWIRFTHTGTPTSTRLSGAVALFTTDGKWHVGCQLASPTSASTTLYIGHSGRSDGLTTTWSATETDRQHIGGITSFYLGGMIGRLLVAPGAGKSITYTLRKNAGGTTQLLTFADTSISEDSVGLDPVQFTAETDLLALQDVPTGTPTVTASFPKFAWWGSNSLPVESFTPCTEGGEVASAADPEDGEPLANAVSPLLWVVLHLDSGDLPFAWIPQADPLTYHAGHKEPRLLSMSRIRRVMSDQFGGLQTPTLDLVVADPDGTFRSRREVEILTNRELSVWMADDEVRRAQGQARRVGHYVLTDQGEPLGDMTFRLRAAGFFGSEVSGFFSEASLDLPIYGDFFPGAPRDLEATPIPAHYGYIADDSRVFGDISAAAPGPVILDTSLGFGGGTPVETDENFGWGDIPGAEPVDLNLAEAAGGEFDSAYTIYVMRTAVIDGVESNPYPTFDGDDIAITGTGKKVQASGSAVTGATAYRWYFSDAPIGHTATVRSFARMVETAGTSAELLGPEDGSVYVVGPPMWAVVIALMNDGRLTEPQRTITHNTGVPQYEGFIQRMPFATRPVRIGWETLADVAEYWVYVRASTGGAFFGSPDSYKTKYIVANTETFLDFIPGMAGGEAVDGLPGFESQLGGITLEYVGEMVMPDGVTRSAFCAGLGALGAIHDLFGSDGAVAPTAPTRQRVDDGKYGITVFAPREVGWPYPTNHVEIMNADGDTLWVTLVFVASDDPIAMAAVDGTIPITANICGLCQDAEGNEAIISSGIKQILHVLTNWGPREDGGWRSGDWKEIPTRNGVPVYRSSAFDTVIAHQDFACAWTLGFAGNLPTIFQFLAAAAINMDLRWSENEHGQLVPHRLDVDATSVATFSDGSVLATTAANIPAHALPRAVPNTHTLVNRITYVYKRNYVTPITRETPEETALLPRENASAPEWFSGEIIERDLLSRAEHKVWRDARIEFSMHRTSTGPLWVVGRLIDRWAWPLDTILWPASLLGMDVPLGSVVTWTHHAGPNAGGSIARKLWTAAQELEPAIDPERVDSLDVWIEAEDITVVPNIPSGAST